MPQTKIIFYKEDNCSVPVLEWLRKLQPKARDKCIVKIERLAALGHELRRPEADYLRDKIYELRIGLQGVNYRIIYFFYGNSAAILSHGIGEVPQSASLRLGLPKINSFGDGFIRLRRFPLRWDVLSSSRDSESYLPSTGRPPASQGVYLFWFAFGLMLALPTLLSLQTSSPSCRRVHTLYLVLVGGLLVGRDGSMTTCSVS